MLTFPVPSRLYLYDMAHSRVTLTAPQKPDQCQLLVCTKLVEPFKAHVNFLYMVLGELERIEGKLCCLRPALPWLLSWGLCCKLRVHWTWNNCL